ncbi:hypothetical protein OPV22_012129 [Ensete ventricosum]|uniref:Tim10-like domain-containing protein n=1 Tax=Ensete ventricosum TaxID=4639 RepID=A0AAV8R464_ENSVE|nr:hypothetical protein OPV22_012129 [Ensete ventricosum]
MMEQIKTQLAQAYAKEFLETVGNKCFAKCITKPDSASDNIQKNVYFNILFQELKLPGIVLFRIRMGILFCEIDILVVM